MLNKSIKTVKKIIHKLFTWVSFIEIFFVTERFVLKNSTFKSKHVNRLYIRFFLLIVYLVLFNTFKQLIKHWCLFIKIYQDPDQNSVGCTYYRFSVFKKLIRNSIFFLTKTCYFCVNKFLWLMFSSINLSSTLQRNSKQTEMKSCYF